MKRILLKEFQRSAPVDLAAAEIEALQRLAPQLRIELSRGVSGQYELTPDSHVGIIRFAETVIEIRPKLPMDRFFFILSYAVDPSLWRREHVEFDAADSVLEAVAPAFCRLVADATRRGLLHGYRNEQQALPLVRGQIRFTEQIQRRYGLLLPVEVSFDEFTEDIDENRILLAALHRLSRLPIRSEGVRRGLHEVMAAFHAVQLSRMTSLSIPVIHFTRLNEHYKPAVSLATLILKWCSLELGQEGSTGTAFLVDMNEVFERFVHRALQEELHLSDPVFPLGQTGLCLDEARAVRMVPDLSWWAGRQCRFVGDVKYKKTTVAGVVHHDLYQLLAYLVATNLQAGMLIYAAGEDAPVQHTVRHAGKTLVVEALNLTGNTTEILAQVSELAHGIRLLAAQSQ